MSSNRPDPGEFFERAQQMMRELFGGAAGGTEPWDAATRPAGERPAREPSAQQQRENLTFALATRAVEALEDLALDVAAIRQRFERLDGQSSQQRPAGDAEPGETDPGSQDTGSQDTGSQDTGSQDTGGTDPSAR
ncbi:hypothetical protein [Modestobacter versicolor]|uniref:hypothetical protein n=1 Tax=Modestobacter versicolor TaxID=429133 RepID=UPI0034DFC6D1